MWFLCCEFDAGPPVCRDEEELRRWLEDPLFASGVESKDLFMMKMTVLPRTMTMTMLKILASGLMYTHVNAVVDWLLVV